MNPKLLLLCLLFAAFVSLSPATAQTPGETTVTEATVLSTPEMSLPPSAAAGLRGEVKVWVMIDAEGNVTEVRRVEGPGWTCPQVPGVIEVHAAAREAAMKAKFIPATNAGVPVASSAWIRFDFRGATETVTSDAQSPASDNVKTTIAAGADRVEANQKFTVMGDRSPPRTYKGPVNTTLKGENPDPAGARDPQTTSGGVLNGKATLLPAPSYPPAARAVRASGAVSIQVLIDENGNVVRAEPISGHPLLRSAARLSACDSKFTPTRLMGYPVKVMGQIVYNFTL